MIGFDSNIAYDPDIVARAREKATRKSTPRLRAEIRVLARRGPKPWRTIYYRIHMHEYLTELWSREAKARKASGVC